MNAERSRDGLDVDAPVCDQDVGLVCMSHNAGRADVVEKRGQLRLAQR
jgi:hypothetical protein